MQWHMFIAVLGAIGMAIIYGYKVNLSVAITVMVNHTAIAHEAGHGHGSAEKSASLALNDTTERCQVASHDESDDAGAKLDGPLLWTPTEYNLAIGSYFYGYILTQIPGGRIAEIGSAKWIFFAAVVMNIVATFLTPVAAYFSIYCVVVLRIIQGFGGGITFPAINVIISHWAPDDKRSSISAIIFGGTSLGTVISLVSAGQIATVLSWEWIFYLHALFPLIWCVAWVVFVSDTPDDHKYISESEKALINAGHTDEDEEKMSVPWRSMFTSVPVWTLIVCHTLNNFGWYMLLVELPIFMSNGLGFDISQNCILSAIPYLLNWIFSFSYSAVLDVLKKRGWLSTTNGLKLSTLLASLVPAASLIGVTMAVCDRTLVVTFMMIGLSFYGSMFSGVFSNHVFLASNFSGVLMGISNTAATLPGIIVPAFVGYITSTPGLGPWHFAFYITAGLLTLEAVIYTLFASGVEQPWNHRHRKSSEIRLDETSKILSQSDEAR